MELDKVLEEKKKAEAAVKIANEAAKKARKELREAEKALNPPKKKFPAWTGDREPENESERLERRIDRAAQFLRLAEVEKENSRRALATAEKLERAAKEILDVVEKSLKEL
jgi:hypothetical protein